MQFNISFLMYIVLALLLIASLSVPNQTNRNKAISANEEEKHSGVLNLPVKIDF